MRLQTSIEINYVTAFKAIQHHLLAEWSYTRIEPPVTFRRQENMIKGYLEGKWFDFLTLNDEQLALWIKIEELERVVADEAVKKWS